MKALTDRFGNTYHAPKSFDLLQSRGYVTLNEVLDEIDPMIYGEIEVIELNKNGNASSIKKAFIDDSIVLRVRA